MAGQGEKQLMYSVSMLIASFLVILLLIVLITPVSSTASNPIPAFTGLIDELRLSSQRNYIEQGYIQSKGYYLVQLLAEKSQCDTNTDELYWYNNYCKSMCDDKPCLCLITADGLESFKDSNSELSAMFSGSAYTVTKDSRGYENLLLSSSSDSNTLRTFTDEFTSKFTDYFKKSPVAHYCSPVKINEVNAIVTVNYDYTFLMMSQCVKLLRVLSGPLSGNEISITAENSQKSC